MATGAVSRVARAQFAGESGGPIRREREKGVRFGAVWDDTLVTAAPPVAPIAPGEMRVLGRDGIVHKVGDDKAFGHEWQLLRQEKQAALDANLYYRFARAIDGLTFHMLPGVVLNETIVSVTDKSREKTEDLRNAMTLKAFEAKVAMGMGVIADLQQRPGNMRFGTEPAVVAPAATAGAAGGGVTTTVNVTSAPTVNMYDDTGSLYRHTTDEEGVPVNAQEFMKELVKLSDEFTKAPNVPSPKASSAAEDSEWATLPINAVVVRLGPVVQAAIDTTVLRINGLVQSGSPMLKGSDDLVLHTDMELQTIFRCMVANEILLTASLQSYEGKKFDTKELRLRQAAAIAGLRNRLGVAPTYNLGRFGIRSFPSGGTWASNGY